MQQLGLNEEADFEVKKGFWRRQFQLDATKSQKRFDWIFGVVLPVACFFFDPIVFKSSGYRGAFLGTYKPFAYILSFVSIMALMAWLIWGAKLKWLGGALAGLFLVGGVVSLGIGVILLPFSVVGLIVAVGALGFTPLFTSLVYLRNSLRAYESARPFLEKRVLVNLYYLSLILCSVIPSVANVQIKETLDEMLRGDAQTIRSNGRKLKFVAPIVNFDVLVERYRFKGNETEREVLVEEYERLAGKNARKRGQFMD
jgi:hypothetical protein